MSFRRPAFTLIELLVVVAVLAILAGLLLPAFSRTRENGRRAACQSNLRQIGLGLQQYSQDWDEILVADWYSPNPSPGATLPAGDPNTEYKWMDAAYPYINSEAVFLCPSAVGQRARPFIYYKRLVTGSGPSTNYGSYTIVHGYGPNVSGATPPVSHPHPNSNEQVKLALVEAPATTAWVLDGDATLGEIDDFQTQVSSNRLTAVAVRHLEQTNVLFLDGHVKAMNTDVLNRRNEAGRISFATIQDD